MYPEPTPSLTADHRPNGKGCLFYGCGGILAVVVVCSLIAWVAYLNLRKELSVPAFPPVVLPEPERQALEVKARALEGPEALSATSSGFRFTDTEINALISGNSSELGKILRVQFRPDVVAVEFLAPIDPPRHLRVRAEAQIRHTAGKLDVQLRHLRIGGIPVPRAFVHEVGLNTVIADLLHFPELAKILTAWRLKVGEGYLDVIPAATP